MISLPPSSTGGVQATVAWALPLVAVTLVGGSGTWFGTVPKFQWLAALLSTVIRASPASAPALRVCRSDTHGSGVAGSSDELVVQGWVGTPSRNTVTVSAVRSGSTDASSDASIVKTSVNGSAELAEGAVMSSWWPRKV